MANDITNPGFETGDATGWTLGANMRISTRKKFAGTYSVECIGTGGVEYLLHDPVPAGEGRVITARCQYAQGAASSGQNTGRIIIRWLDAVGATIREDEGDLISSSTGGRFNQSNITTDPAPANTVAVQIGGWVNRTNGDESYFDQFAWDYDFDRTVTLTSPTDGASYVEGDTVQLRVTIGGTTPAVVGVDYYDNDAVLEVVDTEPYGFNTTTLAVGGHDIKAIVRFSDSTTLTTDEVTITITETPAPPDTREFKASNAYAHLVASNISGLSAAIPAVALVTAVETVVDYNITALVRSKDIGVPDPATSNYNVVFDITDGGTLHMDMLEEADDAYTKTGSGYQAAIPLDRADFTITEEGLSEGKKWTVLESENQSVVIGSDSALFGTAPVAMGEFIARSLGFKFTPNLLPKPAYADSGDCAIRFKIDKLRVRVYFDAGSVEYYFASPDKDHVVKGELVSAEVLDGNFESGDASGVLQIAANLEVVDDPSGLGTAIGCDYTIHAAYPVTDANQIGVVACETGQDAMRYNGLPTQLQVRDNRSRYEMITANFYGSPDLNSIYGAHGLERAFAFNGDWFYKIYTQPDPEKDKPRHVAYHHAHLALGYKEGRVDISVAGKPYSFDGDLGASSWAIGDAVVGLLPLSGTLLGVFGAASVWGISGTTVDNFATQVISPNIGATEYTICDMGFPVYANAYGVYTLAQVQQYGDYMGQPMSQDISPWLRPRLIRKVTSDKEVVCAWPVRSKNQYRLAFSDGYITSMTLNGQAVPTFSFQKYFYDGGGEEPYISDDLYSYPAIVPAAVSSQLDESGEERIHIAPYADSGEPAPEPPGDCAYIFTNSYIDAGESQIRVSEESATASMPSWFEWGITPQFGVRFADDVATDWRFVWASESGLYICVVAHVDDWVVGNGQTRTDAEIAEFAEGYGDWTCLTVEQENAV